MSTSTRRRPWVVAGALLAALGVAAIRRGGQAVTLVPGAEPLPA